MMDKRACRLRSGFAVFMLLIIPFTVKADSCKNVATVLNERLSGKLDAEELTTTLNKLNATANRSLPDRFINKRQARRFGWYPGGDLWRLPALRGKSIGGDIYHNREGRLPAGNRQWHEADLDYHGGHRNGKRLLYADDGSRAVTIDHYRSFIALPECH